MSDRYILVNHLGRGGFGKITFVFDKDTTMFVVQKSLLNPTRENCDRLIREGKLYMLLQQERHIVDLLDYSFDYSNPYLIIPYYKEGTLEKKVGRMSEYDALLCVQHGAAGLNSLHSIGGFHRDVKPSNMFIDKTPDGKWFVRLGDFGLGRVPQPFTSSSITASAFGTPDYIAPELYMPNPKYAAPCDIYSLGISGIELITGSRKRESINNAWINNDAKKLLLDMTNWIPSARPNAATVVTRAREIIQSHNKSVNTALKWGLGILAVGLLFGGDD